MILNIQERVFHCMAFLGIAISLVYSRPPRPFKPYGSPSVHIRVQLGHKLGSLVAILPDGRICISPDPKDENTIIKLWPYGGSYYRLQGEATGLYIAMDSKGSIYTTRRPTDETLFVHKMTHTGYRTFESEQYRGFYFGFRKRRGIPSKGSKTTFWKKTAHFLLYVSNKVSPTTTLQKKMREIWEHSSKG